MEFSLWQFSSCDLLRRTTADFSEEIPSEGSNQRFRLIHELVHGCAVGADRGDGFHALETLLNDGRRLGLIAADDSHFNDFDGFGGWVMVRAVDNAPDTLLAALKAGRYYSTQGPEFRLIRWHDDRVEVETSAVARIIVQGAGVATAVAIGTSMTRTGIDIRRLAESPWLRITIADAAGRRAWTNPVWRD